MQVTTGTLVPTATVVLKFGDHERMAIATGNGPVDAAVSPSNSSTEGGVVGFLMQAITRGSNDVGRVHMQVECGSRTVHGFAAHTDTTRASIEAFLDALRRPERKKSRRRHNMGQTLLDKIWDAHTVRVEVGGRCVLYIDRQYIHGDVARGFRGASNAARLGVTRPAQITATADHNIPTVNQHLPIEARSRRQVGNAGRKLRRHGIEHFGVGTPGRASSTSSGPNWASRSRV